MGNQIEPNGYPGSCSNATVHRKRGADAVGALAHDAEAEVIGWNSIGGKAAPVVFNTQANHLSMMPIMNRRALQLDGNLVASDRFGDGRGLPRKDVQERGR